MGLIGIILVLALVGFLVWAIVTYIPMPAPFQGIIVVVAVIVALLWALGVLGVALPSLRVK